MKFKTLLLLLFAILLGNAASYAGCNPTYKEPTQSSPKVNAHGETANIRWVYTKDDGCRDFEFADYEIENKTTKKKYYTYSNNKTVTLSIGKNVFRIRARYFYKPRYDKYRDEPRMFYTRYSKEQTVTRSNTPKEADLIVTNLNVTPSTVPVGDPVKVSYRIKNKGTASARSTSTLVYISTNSTWDSGDQILCSGYTPSLGAGQSSGQVTKTLSLPPSYKGKNYIIVKADARLIQKENNENNNVSAYAINIGIDCSFKAEINNGEEEKRYRYSEVFVLSTQGIPGATYQWYNNDTKISSTRNTYMDDYGEGNFKVVVSKSGCSSKEDDIKVVMIRSRRYSNRGPQGKMTDVTSINVYPQPANETVRFDLPNAESSYQLEIFNIQGKKVLSKIIANTELINVSDFNSGMYLYNIYSPESDERFNGKLMIK